jgi:hypothetical protein
MNWLLAPSAFATKNVAQLVAAHVVPMRHGRRGIGFVHVDDVRPLAGGEQHVGVVGRLEIVSEDGLVNRGLQRVEVL